MSETAGVVALRRRIGGVVVAVLLCSGAACNQVRKALPSSQPAASQQTEPQSEVQHDKAGTAPVRDVHPPVPTSRRRTKAMPPQRTSSTGRAAANGSQRRAEPTAPPPATDVSTSNTPTSAAETATAKPPQSGAAAPRADADSLDPIDLSLWPPDPAMPVRESERVVPFGSTVTVVTSTPVFVTPNARQVPLVRAGKGATFRVLGFEGGWYRVEWNDHAYGRRQGFLDSRDVALPEASNPVDLSIQAPSSSGEKRKKTK